MKIRSVILILLFILGMRLNSFAEDFFPIGIYGLEVGHTNDLRTLKEAGFNCIQSYQQNDAALRTLLKGCEAEGLKAIVYPGISAEDRSQTALVKQRISQIGNSPALLAWYLIDEPDFLQIPPAQVERMRQILSETKKETSPKTQLHQEQGSKSGLPVALVIGDGHAAGDYAKCADILMVDWYPIPHLPLASFGLAVRQCRFASGPKKSVWGVVQAFDWATEFPRAEKLGIGGFPTETELRAMALLGVIEGASGLFFYTYQDGRVLKPITQRAEDWRQLKSVSQDLAELAPILAARTIWSPMDLGIREDKLRWRNALGDAALQVARKQLTEASGKFEAGDYLLVVNTTNEKRKSSLQVPGLKGDHVRLIGKDRSVPIVNGWIEDDFEPYVTRIYGPLPLER